MSDVIKFVAEHGFADKRRAAERRKKPSRNDSRAKSAEKLAAFYRSYFNRLTNNLRATYGPGPPDPEDVAQRAFETLNKQSNLDDIRDLEGYVWICSRNIIMSEKRSQRVRNENQLEVERRYFSVPFDSFDPERVFMAKEHLDLVMETLRQMPERRRNIFMLCRVSGLPAGEAGRRCGVSRSAAARHLALATAQIAKALAEATSPEKD